jgi:pSer/pThr/pTyr-binding forkhead associated (FHA) protein
VPIAAIPVTAHGALQTNSGYPGVAGLPGQVAGAIPAPRSPVPTTVGTPAGLTSVNRDGSDGRYYPITGDRFDVGRTSGMLLFGDDGYLSDRHVRLEWRDGAWVLVDLSSLNGTFLRIRSREEVMDGDTLLVGMQVLKFELLSGEERDPAPAVEHGVLYFGTPPRRPWGRLRQVTTAGICRDVLHLYRPEVVIGRESGDIVFSDDEFMSRAHTALRNDAGRAYLVDLNSSNGTYLRIRKERKLSPGDFLRMGDQLLRFTLRA